MKIAIMMAAHNAAPFIGDAIASLLRQRDAAELDIVVVDDGSTDGTADAALAIGAREVRVFRQSNMGVTRTRNVLLSKLAPDTDFVTLLDSDDLSPAGRFATDLQQFADDPSLELIFGTSLLFAVPDPADPLAPDLGQRTMRVRGVQMGAGLYRYGLIRATGRYDESFEQAEDLDFMLRMLEQSPRFCVTDRLTYYYRQHGTNMTRNTDALRRGNARALMMAARRRARSGAPAIPAGFFDLHDFARGLLW